MQCRGSTADRTVTKNYEVIGTYAECTMCGRIYWIIKPDGIIPSEKQEK